LGHGAGYQYPHDAESGWLDQQYLPDPLVGARFYEPGLHGAEAALVADWQARRSAPAATPTSAPAHDVGPLGADPDPEESDERQ
jgi:replication-associated recombination protein RarA